MNMIEKAIRGSIIKWVRIYEETGYDKGVDNCPLCRMFWKESPEGVISCDGCPVKECTGENGCRETPYDDCTEEVNDEEQKETVMDEILLLFSLLEEV